MLTQFTPKTKAILIELLTRGIEAIKSDRIGEPADLGILAKSIPAALAIYLDDDGFDDHKDHFLEQFNGEFRNPKLQAYLLDFTESAWTKNAGVQLEQELIALRGIEQAEPEFFKEYLNEALSCDSFLLALYRYADRHADEGVEFDSLLKKLDWHKLRRAPAFHERIRKLAAGDSGNADADADADADVGTDLDELNATANAIANESIEFDAEPEPVL